MKRSQIMFHLTLIVVLLHARERLNNELSGVDLTEGWYEAVSERLPDGSFADPTLEQEYQEILDLDSRARFSLTASQVALAATIVLFIIDLPRGGTGEDIPYHPPRLQVGNAPGNRLTVTYRFPY